MQELTVKQIAEALGVSSQAVNYRARKEGWKSTPLKKRGGGKAFRFQDLPEEVREQLRTASAMALRSDVPAKPKPAKAPAPCPAPLPAERAVAEQVVGEIIDAEVVEERTALEPEVLPAETSLPSLPASSVMAPPAVPGEPELDAERKRVALARYDLAMAYRKHLIQADKGGKMAARASFIQLYQVGCWPDLSRILGPKISWRTVERWAAMAEEANDPFVLADRRGLHRQNTTSLSEYQAIAVLRLVLHPNRLKLSVCIRMAKEMLHHQGSVEPFPSEMTVRRFLSTWKKTNYDIWVFLREGAKAWNDKVAYYIERNLDALSVGDILVADGHVLNFQVINPLTGKATRMMMVLWLDMASSMPLGWEIAPTENTQAIASALRRALMRLGKVGRIAYLDNGRAFKGKHFTDVDLSQCGLGGLFARIGMETIFAWAYHGQSKTIERFFGTFSELETMLPSYSGRSIELKPPRMSRGETMHRKLYEESGGRPLTIEEANTAVAAWFDLYAQRPQKGHLKGKTPLEVFETGRGDGLSEELTTALRECMLSTKEREIGRHGVKIFGRNYYDQALYGRKHKAYVRYDLQDQDAIEVYDEQWRYICTARPKAHTHAAARHLGTEEDERMLKAQIEMKKVQEKMAGATARALLQNEILPANQKQAEKIAALPKPEETPELDVPELTPAQIERIEKAKAAHLAKKEAERKGYKVPDYFATELDRYEFLFHVRYRDEKELNPDDAAFMTRFENSPEYQVARGRYVQLSNLYAKQKERAALGETTRKVSNR